MSVSAVEPAEHPAGRRGAATSRGRPPSRPRVELLVASVVAISAALIASVGSWSVSLWSDEVATISASSRSLHDLGRLVQHIDAVHGTYYALVHEWTAWFGAAPAVLRFPSAVAVGIAAAGVYVLVARIADAHTALLAAGIFSVLPRVTWAGIEARSFALTIATAIWLTVFLHVAVSGRSRRPLFAYAAILAVAVMLNLYLVFIPAAHAVTLLLRPRTRRAFLPFAMSAAVGVLLAGPVVIAGLKQGGQLGQRERGALDLARNVIVNQWLLGETPTGTTSSGASLVGAAQASSVWKFAAVGAALVCWALVAHALHAAWRRPDPATRELVAWTVPWLLLPTLLVEAYAVVSPSAYNARYFSFSAPALAILIAIGLRRFAPRLTAGVAALVVLLILPVYASQRTMTAKSGSDWAMAAAWLDGRTRPGDGVYFAPRDGATGGPILRSLRTVRIGYPAPFDGLLDVSLVASPAAGATLFGTSASLPDVLGRLDGLDRLWVLRRQDRMTDSRADDQLLSAAGFDVVEVWDGPQTQVVEMARG